MNAVGYQGTTFGEVEEVWAALLASTSRAAERAVAEGRTRALGGHRARLVRLAHPARVRATRAPNDALLVDRYGFARHARVDHAQERVREGSDVVAGDRRIFVAATDTRVVGEKHVAAQRELRRA